VRWKGLARNFGRGLEAELVHRVSATGSNVSLPLLYSVFCRFRVRYSGIERESINSQRRVMREGDEKRETKQKLHTEDVALYGGPGRAGFDALLTWPPMRYCIQATHLIFSSTWTLALVQVELSNSIQRVRVP